MLLFENFVNFLLQNFHVEMDKNMRKGVQSPHRNTIWVSFYLIKNFCFMFIKTIKYAIEITLSFSISSYTENCMFLNNILIKNFASIF